MAVWTVIHYELGGNPIGEMTPLDLEFGIYLDRPCYVNYAIPVGHDLARIQYTNPYVTDFRLLRDEMPLIGGLHTEFEADDEGNTFQVSGQDWKHYFEKRFWPFNPADPAQFVYAAVQADSFVIVDHILDTVLSQAGSPSFTYSLGTSGTLTNFRVDPADGEDIHSKIQGIANEKPGFDWMISPTKIITAYTPHKGSQTNFVLEENKNIKRMFITNMGVRASHVLGLGAGSQSRLAVLFVNQFVGRRYDHSADFGDVIDITRLNRLTAREGAIWTTQALQLRLVSKQGADEEIWDNLNIGDTVLCVGDVQGYDYIEDYFRIVGIEGTVNENGDEEITMITDTLDND